ncbi:MAG: HAD-IIA family hydrolase [Actinomycetota bacterium]|nr:HAD-IIA family hydrolase [Actinomycetota bacterium]
MPLAPALAAYDTILLDLDGCVWVGAEPTPRAVEAVAALRAAGRRVGFVTNDGRPSEEDLVRKLWGLGIQASREEVVTVGGALQYALAEAQRSTAFVIGSPSMHRHVADAGLRILNGSDLADRAEVVVVAEHDGFDYHELKDAVRAGLRGAELWCTGRDANFPDEGGISPGTGAIVAAVEYATGATARSVGKPEPQIFVTALDRLGGERALMIGDRLDADVAGAHAAGISGALVLTGGDTVDDARAAERSPDHVAANLGDLVLGR